MKKAIVVAIFCVLVTVSLASASNGGIEYIIPYSGGPSYVFEVDSDDYVYIRAGWATCTYGLTQAFTRQANFTLSIDSETLISSRKAAKDFWSTPYPLGGGPVENCIPNTDTYYRAWWDYPLGYLEPGEYEGHFRYWQDHTIPDGGDYDGDGKPDLWQIDLDTWFTIIVY
jgi:hypothetical protein